MNDSDLITVCENCLCASCWTGDHMCMEYQFSGFTKKTVKELKELNLENPYHWEKQLQENK